MKNLGKNSKGFFNLFFLIIITSFISLYFTCAFGIALSQQRDYVRTTCLTQATTIQSDTLSTVRELFNYNGESTALRTSVRVLTEAIAAALAVENFPLAMSLQNELDAVKAAQKILDFRQKFLLNKARLQLSGGHLNLVSQINSTQHNLKNPWKNMILMFSVFRPISIPELPVRPDSANDIAPNYEWQENAETRMKLAYAWNMYFSTIDEDQKILSWRNSLNIKCSVSPDLRGAKWKLKINKARSSWNSF